MKRRTRRGINKTLNEEIIMLEEAKHAEIENSSI